MTSFDHFNRDDALSRLKDDMLNHGLEPPEFLTSDGEIHRFKQQGDKDKPCWYIIFEHHNFMLTVYGCWKRDIKKRWCSRSYDELSLSEKQQIKQALKQVEALEEEVRKQHQQEVAIACQNRWLQATVAHEHPYLTTKQVKPVGLRQDDERLIIPLYAANGTLMSLQTIDANGNKRFTSGGRKQGCFFPIGQLTQRIYICEGVATGLSIYEASHCHTIVAFDAGNLKSVAEAIRQMHPLNEIIITGDNDAEREEDNIGLRKAKEAANAINAAYVIPDLGTAYKKGDFNDLMVEQGLDAVRAQLQPQAHNKIKCLSVHELMTTAFPPRVNIINPWLPTKGLAMVYAQRGIGKTFFALSVALAISQGKSLCGWQIDKPRGVLYIDGEMPAEVIQERLKLIGNTADTNQSTPFKFIARDLNGDQSLDLTDITTQRMIEAYLDDIDLIIVDNISTLCPGKENESESWVPIQEFALRMRSSGRAVLFVHHAGKNGLQRGTSKREDILDTVIALKRPKDYTPKDGACFELHFEKSRSFYDEETEPMLCKLVTLNEQSQWEVSSLAQSTYQKVVELKQEGLTPLEIAEELGINKSTVSRHLKRAKEEGLQLVA